MYNKIRSVTFMQRGKIKSKANRKKQSHIQFSINFHIKVIAPLFKELVVLAISISIMSGPLGLHPKVLFIYENTNSPILKSHHSFMDKFMILFCPI